MLARVGSVNPNSTPMSPTSISIPHPRRLAALIGLGLAAALPASAAVISVNFIQAAGQALTGSFGVTNQSTVVGGWLNLNQVNAASALPFSDGTPSAVNLTGTSTPGWSVGNAAYIGTAMQSGKSCFSTTLPASRPTFTLTNLNAVFPKGCKVIVYVSGFLTATNTFITDGATTYYYRAATNATEITNAINAGLFRTTQTTDLGNANNPLAQYAVFGDPVPLTNNLVTFTLGTTVGAGSWIGGFQIVGDTNKPPVAKHFTAGVSQGGSATFPVVGGKYAPSDPEGDPLTVTAVQNPSANGAAVSTDGTNVFVNYAPVPGFTGTDTFTYTVTDSAGGADTRIVTVLVTAGTGFNQLFVESLGGGAARLTYLGIPGMAYALDWRTNLTMGAWVPVVTNAAAANGRLVFTNVTAEPANFYRTRHVP